MTKLFALENFDYHFPNMRLGRFTLKAGEKISIHIHSGQFGFVYLLKGKCVLFTYKVDEIDNGLLELNLDSKETIVTDAYSIMTPKKNAHLIEAVEDSIFLDIFAPGKSGGERLSDYLDIIKSEQNDSRLIARTISTEYAQLPESLKNESNGYTEVN